jgi:hypothetical protein
LLKMEACSFETSVDFQWSTRRYIPEDRTLHNHYVRTSDPTYWEQCFSAGGSWIVLIRKLTIADRSRRITYSRVEGFSCSTQDSSVFVMSKLDVDG